MGRLPWLLLETAPPVALTSTRARRFRSKTSLHLAQAALCTKSKAAAFYISFIYNALPVVSALKFSLLASMLCSTFELHRASKVITCILPPSVFLARIFCMCPPRGL